MSVYLWIGHNPGTCQAFLFVYVFFDRCVLYAN